MQDPIIFFNFEYIYQLIYYLITGKDNFGFLEPIWYLILILGYILTILFIIGIIYSLIRISRIRREESEILDILTNETLNRNQTKTDPRWARVMEHMSSGNENEWRLAIIECDLILDDLLTTMTYDGLTVGEKLKSIEKSDFNTIDMAWEAHKVRNKIAHEGSNFALSEREARRVIGLYRTVFEEFEYV